MTRLGVLLVLLIAAFPSTLTAAATRPIARVRAGVVVVSLPVDLLAQGEVRRQLPSGLTTTFVITAQAGERRGAARVEVRYEPWDEVYLVTTRTLEAAAQTVRLSSLERLTAWWRETAIPVLARGVAPNDIQLSVEVLPFSIEEQRDTQRWLARSLGDAHQEPAGSDAEAAASARGGSVLDVIIGTSIQRRPLLKFRWTVQVLR